LSLERAEQGEANAQFRVGLMCQGLSWDGEAFKWGEAVKWFCQAAEQGHVTAQYKLGEIYEYGLGA